MEHNGNGDRRSFDRSKRVYVVKSQTYAVTESATDWETGEPRELRLPLGLPRYQVTQPNAFGPDTVRDYDSDVVGAREHAWAHNAELED